MTTGDSTQRAVDESVVQAWIARVLEAFNAHDVDRFVTVGTHDIVFDHSASPTTLRGRAEVRSFYAANWTAFPDVRLELADGPFPHPHAPRVGLLWHVSGTNTGPLDPPGLPPTGNRIELPVCEFAEFRGELICRTRIVVDMASFLGQLGLLPAPPGSPT